jgi:hypothetical protein
VTAPAAIIKTRTIQEIMSSSPADQDATWDPCRATSMNERQYTTLSQGRFDSHQGSLHRSSSASFGLVPGETTAKLPQITRIVLINLG